MALFSGVRTSSEFFTSERLSVGYSTPLEVNRRIVLAAREMGCGRAALEVSCCIAVLFDAGFWKYFFHMYIQKLTAVVGLVGELSTD